MEITINKTPPKTRRYPPHRHRQYEIMHYTEGTGHMWTDEGELAFSPGTAIVMPPNVLHGSVAPECFVNISIECDFDGLVLFDTPTVIAGDSGDEGSQLVHMIWENRHATEAYLHALCIAYVQYLLRKAKIENAMTLCIGQLLSQISEHAYDPDLDVGELLSHSGYAPDYVRSCFKRETGKTPGAYLTELRIKHACYLIEIYKESLSLSRIAELCGYTDYVYFSKKFKKITGTSPRRYRNG